MSRRTAMLGALGLGACGLEVPSAATRPTGDGWAEFPLADFPQLAQPGGSALLQRPEALIDVWVLRRTDGSFGAVWRVCTHGACAVEPRPDESFECPCHGSRFALSGAVLQGPATRALQTFDAVKVEGTLFVRRSQQ